MTRTSSRVEPSRIEEIDTGVGIARAHLFDVSRGVPRSTLVIGHEARAGLEAWDLQLLAARLPERGIEVALVEQPWQVAGQKSPPEDTRLDVAFREVVLDLKRSGLGLRRLITAGRSSAARVACRVAAQTEPDAVLCLSYPLLRPGRGHAPRIDDLVQAARTCPVDVVQGGRDRFATPLQIADAARSHGVDISVAAIPQADHMFELPRRAANTRPEIAAILVEAVSNAILTG